MTQSPQLSDVATLRRQARQHIERGAVTENYRGDRQRLIGLLNEALATELVCVLRYKQHYFLASGLNAESVSAEFLEHAQQEMEHADALSRRIVQLGGKPDLCPDRLSSQSHAEYVECDSLYDMIRENLVAERIAIDSYREMINFIGNNDPTTRRLLEDILAVEEEHADDMAGLLGNLPAGPTGASEKERYYEPQ
ncbi:ferritin-like domain-containing protein [Chitinimonas lacunae]|uniref:Bacterioferritin n=1 Tax=Chitinimonas lacunae TaxID=1963018 RepID=A0ABV8MND9_9NEIS